MTFQSDLLFIVYYLCIIDIEVYRFFPHHFDKYKIYSKVHCVEWTFMIKYVGVGIGGSLFL